MILKDHLLLLSVELIIVIFSVIMSEYIIDDSLNNVHQTEVGFSSSSMYPPIDVVLSIVIP